MPSATPQAMRRPPASTPSRSASSAARPVPRRQASRSHTAVSSADRANGLPRTPTRSSASASSGESTRGRSGAGSGPRSAGAARRRASPRSRTAARTAATRRSRRAPRHRAARRPASAARASSPPEMMNGSSSGSVRSYSSIDVDPHCGPSRRACAVTSRKWSSPSAALQRPACLELEHARDQAVHGIEEQRVERRAGYASRRWRDISAVEAGRRCAAGRTRSRRRAYSRSMRPGADVAGAGERRRAGGRRAATRARGGCGR